MEKSISQLKKFIIETESKKEKLILEKLSYSKQDLEPVMSEKTLNYHYGTLAKGYVDRFNSGEGDAEFNQAGAFLHNIFFAQFNSPGNTKPFGSSLEFINRYFENFESMKKDLESEAMKIQGSGWIYLSKSGAIKTIKNHAIKNDIILLVDWWEHAWALDYQADKAKYLKNLWRIIDWSVINDRLNVVKS